MFKRTLLPLVTAAAVTLSLVVAGCSQGDAAGTEASTTLPIYTPSAGSGDPVTSGAGSASASGSTGMTTDSDAPDASTAAVTPSGTATAHTTSATPGATGSTITVMPTRPTVTLALSASISISPRSASSREDAIVAESYEQALAMIDNAYSNPNDDWASKASDFLLPPYETAFIQAVAALHNANLHGVGHVFATGSVVARNDDVATIEACIDTSHAQIVDQNGNSNTAANSPSSLWRYKSTIAMRFHDNHWKITESIDKRDQPC